MKTAALVVGEWYAVKEGPSSTSCYRAMVLDTAQFEDGVRGVALARQSVEYGPIRPQVAPASLIVELWAAYEVKSAAARFARLTENEARAVAWTEYEARVEAAASASGAHVGVPSGQWRSNDPPSTVTIPLAALETLLTLAARVKPGEIHREQRAAAERTDRDGEP